MTEETKAAGSGGREHEGEEPVDRQQLVDLGSAVSRSKRGNIYTLTIVGQVEGHQLAPDTAKTTKYEHVMPLLAGLEQDDEIDYAQRHKQIEKHRFQSHD